MKKEKTISNEIFSPALKNFGVFSQPKYSSEKYVDPNPNPFRKLREGTKPFYVSGGQPKSKAGNADGYFGEFKRLFSGEDFGKLLQRRSKSEQQVKRAWIPPGAGKMLCGVGSQYGNFTPIIPYFDGARRDQPKKPPSGRNIYTNPGKKGTGYGYPNVALNPLPEWKAGDALSSELNRVSIKALNKQHIELCRGRAPFITTFHSGRDFNTTPYSGGDPLAPGGAPKINFREKYKPKGKSHDTAFWPSKAVIPIQFPKYMSEPFVELAKSYNFRSLSRSPQGQPKWYPPASTALEKPTKSVIDKNVDLAINSVTRKSRRYITHFCEI